MKTTSRDPRPRECARVQSARTLRPDRMKRSVALTAAAAAAVALPLAGGFGVHLPGLAGAGAVGSTRAARATPLPLRSLRATAVKVKTGGSGGDDDGDAKQRPWPAKESRVKDYSLMAGEVAVRFINSPGRYPSGAAVADALPRVACMHRPVHDVIVGRVQGGHAATAFAVPCPANASRALQHM